jgi:hypothetical protein
MVYPHTQYEGPAHRPGAGSETPPSIRELDSRVSDGIHVRLLWHPREGHVSVAVHDTKTGELFDLPVPAGARPLDVYRHPYAYAAGQAAISSRSARSQLPSSSAPESSSAMK